MGFHAIFKDLQLLWNSSWNVESIEVIVLKAKAADPFCLNLYISVLKNKS